MVQLSFIVAGTSAVVLLSAYLRYFSQIQQRLVRPSLLSWTLWTFTACLNFSSYFSMTNDLVKAASSLVVFILNLCVVLFLLSAGRERSLRAQHVVDWIAFAISLVAVGGWWFFRSATAGNLLMQFGVVVSFVPTIRNVWRDPTSEETMAWFLWALAEVLTLLVVLLRWENRGVDLVAPAISLVLTVFVYVRTLVRVGDRARGS